MNSEGNYVWVIPLDDSIRAGIWNALRNEDAARPMKMGSFSVEVDCGEVYLNGYLPAENNPARVESIIHSVLGVTEVHNNLRTNNGILADTWEALWKEDNLRSLDMGSLSVDVKDGEVYLTGHVAGENNRRLIERIARSVPGVAAVHNDLVIDCDLIIQVTQALTADEQTRSLILPVSASHGWISLGGEAPNRAVQKAAVKAAGSVPGVRGVISLPRVAGESQSDPKQPVQPRIGAIVYAGNGDVGVVTEVVIQPDNPLVTHVVVHIRDTPFGGQIQPERRQVLPLEAFSRVKEDCLFLDRAGQPISAYPAYDPDEYPLAPFTWKAPYPYTAGQALWSLREILDAESPAAEPGTKAAPTVKGAPMRAIAPARARAGFAQGETR